MPIKHLSRPTAVCCTIAAASLLALACSDFLSPPVPRAGHGSPRFTYQDPALESPSGASGGISLPERVTSVGAMSTLVGHFPYSTVVRFDVSGSHILTSVTGADGTGSYGLQGRSCQTGGVGTTSFGGATTSWNACNAPIGNQRTDYSDYINLTGDVYLYHAGDGGSTPAYPDCTHDCFWIGGGSQLTLTRVEASLDLTTTDAPAQSAGVYVVTPGTSLTFGWAVSPASVASTGGTIKLGAVTNSASWEITRPAGNVVACPYFPYASGNNYRYCQVRADSAITVKLTAITNGAWKSKSIQVIPRRSFRLSGPTSATEGDTATFNPTLDGQPIQVTTWAWRPDHDSSDVGTGWDGPGLTRQRVMRRSGYLIATLAYAGGGSDKDSVHVNVDSPCPTSHAPLNDPQLRGSLMNLLSESGPDLPPGDGIPNGGNQGNKREHGGWIFQRTDGSYYFREDTLGVGTECSFRDSMSVASLKESPTDLSVAHVHTHPTKSRKKVYGCPPGATGDSTQWAQGPWDTGHPVPSKDPDSNQGGGSIWGDWISVYQSRDEYVINADGEIWFLSKDLTFSEQPHNTDHIRYKGNADSKCNW